LPDCGSSHFAQSILSIKKFAPETRIEVLIPDFKGREDNLRHIWDAKPDIINHNVETVPSLYKKICPQSRYELSLKVLRLSKEQGFLTKSGIILGLGEELDEVKQVMKDLRNAGVDMLTIGQYLPPGPFHAPLAAWIGLPIFDELKSYGYSLKFRHIESSPLVRSSYHAGDGITKLLEQNGAIL
jgi:lipoic acid synthetase